MIKKVRAPAEPVIPGRTRWFFYVIIRNSLWLVAKVLFRFSVTGAHHIPASGAVVLVANHASFVDPIFLSICTHRWVHYWMYSSFYHSIAKPLFDFFCCMPVDETKFIEALRLGSRLLEQGGCLGVFPEGAVSYDGKLLASKPGALFVAQRMGIPVIPVTLVGNHDVFPRGAWIPRLKELRVVVNEPILLSKDLSREDVGRAMDKIMAIFAKNLGQEWPPEEPLVFPPKELPPLKYY